MTRVLARKLFDMETRRLVLENRGQLWNLPLSIVTREDLEMENES